MTGNGEGMSRGLRRRLAKGRRECLWRWILEALKGERKGCSRCGLIVGDLVWGEI